MAVSVLRRHSLLPAGKIVKSSVRQCPPFASDPPYLPIDQSCLDQSGCETTKEVKSGDTSNQRKIATRPEQEREWSPSKNFGRGEIEATLPYANLNLRHVQKPASRLYGRVNKERVGMGAHSHAVGQQNQQREMLSRARLQDICWHRYCFCRLLTILEAEFIIFPYRRDCFHRPQRVQETR